MAYLQRFTKLQEGQGSGGGTQVFTLTLSSRILRDAPGNAPNLYSREIFYAYHRWTVTFLRKGVKHLSCYLTWRDVSPNITCCLDARFTLLSHAHFTNDVTMRLDNCEFTTDRPSYGSRTFVALDQLVEVSGPGAGEAGGSGTNHFAGTEYSVTNENSGRTLDKDFLIDVELRNGRSYYEQVLTLTNFGFDFGSLHPKQQRRDKGGPKNRSLRGSPISGLESDTLNSPIKLRGTEGPKSKTMSSKKAKANQAAGVSLANILVVSSGITASQAPDVEQGNDDPMNTKKKATKHGPSGDQGADEAGNYGGKSTRFTNPLGNKSAQVKNSSEPIRIIKPIPVIIDGDVTRYHGGEEGSYFSYGKFDWNFVLTPEIELVVEKDYGSVRATSVDKDVSPSSRRSTPQTTKEPTSGLGSYFPFSLASSLNPPDQGAASPNAQGSKSSKRIDLGSPRPDGEAANDPNFDSLDSSGPSCAGGLASRLVPKGKRNRGIQLGRRGGMLGGGKKTSTSVYTLKGFNCKLTRHSNLDQECHINYNITVCPYVAQAQNADGSCDGTARRPSARASSHSTNSPAGNRRRRSCQNLGTTDERVSDHECDTTSTDEGGDGTRGEHVHLTKASPSLSSGSLSPPQKSLFPKMKPKKVSSTTTTTAVSSKWDKGGRQAAPRISQGNGRGSSTFFPKHVKPGWILRASCDQVLYSVGNSAANFDLDFATFALNPFYLYDPSILPRLNYERRVSKTDHSFLIDASAVLAEGGYPNERDMASRDRRSRRGHLTPENSSSPEMGPRKGLLPKNLPVGGKTPKNRSSGVSSQILGMPKVTRSRSRIPSVLTPPAPTNTPIIDDNTLGTEDVMRREGSLVDIFGSGGPNLYKLQVVIYVELVSVHVVTELRPFVELGKFNLENFYDPENQAWCLEVGSRAGYLTLTLYYSDIMNVPRNHLRYISWSACLIANPDKVVEPLLDRDAEAGSGRRPNPTFLVDRGAGPKDPTEPTGTAKDTVPNKSKGTSADSGLKQQNLTPQTLFQGGQSPDQAAVPGTSKTLSPTGSMVSSSKFLSSSNLYLTKENRSGLPSSDVNSLRKSSSKQGGFASIESLMRKKALLASAYYDEDNPPLMVRDVRRFKPIDIVDPSILVSSPGRCYSRYYTQSSNDNGLSMRTQFFITELLDPKCPFLWDKNQIVVRIEWLDSVLLTNNLYGKNDELTKRQYLNMRNELDALSRENLSLEKQLHSYQRTISLYNARESNYNTRKVPNPKDNLNRADDDERDHLSLNLT